MKGRLLFLGTGSSLGVPVIGCSCFTCTSCDVRDKRNRASALVSFKDKNILIDPGPDYRAAALQYKIDRLDGVIITHAHYDHIGGMDELRVYGYGGKRLPCFLLEETFRDVKRREPHFFKQRENDSDYSHLFSWNIVSPPVGMVDFGGISIDYVTFLQKGMSVMGVRFGDLAYISDIRDYDSGILRRLHGIETLVISAARETSNDMHFSVEEALCFAQSIQPKPKKIYLTHIAHEISYAQVEKKLPPDAFLAYDGLALDFVISL